MNKLDKKILFLTPYFSNGGSSNFRVYTYEDQMKEELLGYKILNFWPKVYIDKFVYQKHQRKGIVFLMMMFSMIRFYIRLLCFFRYDIIHIHKNPVPYLGVPVKVLKRFGKKIVFEIDDSIYTQKPNRKFFYKAIKYSDAVIAGNDTLYTYCKELNENAYLIPTVINLKEYTGYQYKKETEKFVVGWIGSDASINNFDVIMDVFDEFKSDLSIEFRYISSVEKSYLQQFENTNFIKWNKETYVKEMNEFDIGIMPLYVDEFNENKSAFKLIQYMGLGIPYIASSVGANIILTEETNAGLLADSTSEWIFCIQQFKKDNDLLQEKSNNGLIWSRKKYNTKAQFQVLLSIWNKV